MWPVLRVVRFAARRGDGKTVLAEGGRLVRNTLAGTMMEQA